MNEEIEKNDGAEFLRKFSNLPKRYNGSVLQVEFRHDGRFARTWEDNCIALKLPLGETVSQSSTKVEPGELEFTVYAKKEMAERIIAMAKDSVAHTRVKTICGVGQEINMLTERTKLFCGLLITEILGSEPGL